MTEQEQQLIRDLFQQLRQLDGQPKDVQADASIRQLAAQAPDAAYKSTDWSRFEKYPLFKEANRMNAYNTYLLMEQEKP